MLKGECALAGRLEWHEEMGNAENALRVGGELRDFGQAFVIYSRPEFGTGLNFAFRFRSSDEDISRLLGRVVEWMSQRSVRPHVRVNPLSQPPDLAERLQARGFAQTESETQMVLAGPDIEPPTNPEVEVVSAGLHDLETWVRIQNIGFGGDANPAPSFLELAAATEAGGGRPYLARLNGEAVGAAVLESFGDVWGIYGVATLPQCRGRGIGTVLVRRMIRDARAAADWPICLQVETGSVTEKWYERLGFRAVYDRTGWTLEV